MFYLLDKKDKVLFSSHSKIECDGINELHNHKAKVMSSHDLKIEYTDIKRILHLMSIYGRDKGFVDFVIDNHSNKLKLVFFDSDPLLNGESAAKITKQELCKLVKL